MPMIHETALNRKHEWKILVVNSVQTCGCRNQISFLFAWFRIPLRIHSITPGKASRTMPWIIAIHQSINPAFYPRPVLAFGYCSCLRLSVRPSVTKLARAIAHHPFKLGSPNLDHRCKKTFKVKFNFKVKIYPILSLSARKPITRSC